MNRLTSAATTATTGADAWSEAFSIDPWGNMKQSGSYTFNPNFDVNNRISQTGYSYDAAGNLLTDTFHSYAYDAEERMKSVDTTAATYTYGPDGERARKDFSDGTWNEYVYFGGQVIAEKSSAGDWTDYIFANGQRIAKAEALDNGLRSYGTKNASGQWAINYFGNAAGLANYTIQSGDKLYLTQYQLSGSKGGVVLNFTDGSNSSWSVKDKEGYYLNDDQTQANTHFRTIDLSSLAGKIISKVGLNQETDTVNSSWAMIFEQMSLVSLDGTVHPIYTGQTSSPITSSLQSGGETGIGSHIDVNRGKATSPSQTTTYYIADHLGSSRLIASGNGYPIWSGVFLPYGQEWNPQITMNHYKFTGDERDAESNLDHTWFRQYEGTQGRWLTPDPAGVAAEDPANPQSLNRYTYAANSSINFGDQLGLWCSGDAGSRDTPCNPGNSGGYGDGGPPDEFGLFDTPVQGVGDGITGFERIPIFLDSNATAGNVSGIFEEVPIFGPSLSPTFLNAFDWFSVGGSFSESIISDIVKSAKRFVPQICSGGGFGYGSVGIPLFPHVGLESVGLIEYDTKDGGSHGGVLGLELGPAVVGVESIRTWNDWQTHTGPIGIGGKEFASASRAFGKNVTPKTLDGGGFVNFTDGAVNVGGYLGGKVFGGGGYVSLSWNGCKH